MKTFFLLILLSLPVQASSPGDQQPLNEVDMDFHRLSKRLFQNFGSVEMTIASPLGDTAYGYVAMRHFDIELPNYKDGVEVSEKGEILNSDTLTRLFITQTKSGQTLFHPNSSILKVWINMKELSNMNQPSEQLTESIDAQLEEMHIRGISPFGRSFSWTRDPRWGHTYMTNLARMSKARLVTSTSLLHHLRKIK